MLFILPKKTKMLSSNFKTRVMLNAYMVIKHYPINGAEALLDNYIKQTYDMSFKDFCLDLLLHMTFQLDKDNNVLVVFQDPAYDRRAQLVTFGNGVLSGSRILQKAFNA